MMQDFVQKIALPENKFKKIHGHTKIELRKADTGEIVQTVEHDNTFQAEVIQHYLETNGDVKTNWWNNSNWTNKSMLKNLLGGIFLFKDSVPANSEFMPAGNKMIGNGCMDIANNAEPQELGSYNAIESVLGEHAATFVYDWGTSQGNGQISCVCLTSDIGGYIGYGNPSGQRSATLKDFNENQSYSTFSQKTIMEDSLYTFNVDNTAKKLTVTKKKISIKNANIFPSEETYELSFAESIGTGGQYVSVQPIDDSSLCISGYGTISSNGGIGYFLIYNCETNTLQQGKIINTVTPGITLRFNYFYSGGNSNTADVCQLYVAGDFAYVSKSAGGSESSDTYIDTIYKFNWRTGAFVETITLDPPVMVGRTGDYYSGCVFGYVYAPYVKFTDSLYYYSGQALTIHDPVNDTFFPTNAKGRIMGSTKGVIAYNHKLRCFTKGGQATNTYYYSGASGALLHHPMYLATINNLETPVVKDSTMVMKVTYTLTEAQEQEENE